LTPARPRPQVDDAITEALENDNLQLQGLASQKYVQLNPMFGDSVAAWQKRLGTVDAVLTTWTDVQKKWQALESIFVGSPDIRVQLPEDSKRFAAVNADYQVRAGACVSAGRVPATRNAGLVAHLPCCLTSWPPISVCDCPSLADTPLRFLVRPSAPQDLMRSAPDVTNVVEAANTEGRQERMEGMLTQLESCEKALQVGAGGPGRLGGEPHSLPWLSV
jgi:hypothetical protein